MGLTIRLASSLDSVTQHSPDFEPEGAVEGSGWTRRQLQSPLADLQLVAQMSNDQLTALRRRDQQIVALRQLLDTVVL